jgi:hypothetical protein
MASISGQSTTNINDVDGFYTTSGGSGISPNTLPALGVNGTVQVGGGSIITNPGVTIDFNIGATSNNTFSKIVGRTDSGVTWIFLIAIKTDGSLWYNISNGQSPSFNSWATTKDGEWHRYGSDNDWTDISAENACFTAVKNGDLMFVGYGAYRQRGDGSTSSTSSWVVTNNTLTWTKTSLGFRLHGAITDTGHAYFCGYNYDYMSGQGTSSGSNATLTREQNSLTGCTDVAASCYRHCKILKDSNIYSQGRNNSNFSGPLITSTSDINGPTLSYSGGDIAKIFRGNYWAYMALTTTGQLRFAGNGSYRARPDGSTTSMQGASSFGLIDGGATGYTHYEWYGYSSSATWPALAIKSGQITLGGGSASYLIKEALGSPPSTTAWINVGQTGAVVTGGANNLGIAVGW